MHAGISPAGADHRDALTRYPSDSVLDDVLDGAAVLLRLPAGISRAVVADCEFDIAQSRLWASVIPAQAGIH